MSTDKYKTLGTDIGQLTDQKNLAYGDSFSKSAGVMQLLYPLGIGVDQLQDALLLVRIIDKMFRIANHKSAFAESPYRDIAGYGLLGAAAHECAQEQWGEPDEDEIWTGEPF